MPSEIEKLPLGAMIIESRRIESHLSVIICKLAARKQYATWIYNHDISGCVEGHYFDDLEIAANDFKTRR
jgi:hypothetical protein